jgi:AraC family transcriptional regulator
MKTRPHIYRQRIDRVLDYISEHPDGDLSIATLAGIAHFSPYHFHRVFHAVVGEPVNGFVRRVRLERAARLMKASPRTRLTEVALASGFAGLAEFSRAFKAHFGMSPSRWDRKSPFENSQVSTSPEMFPFGSAEEVEAERKAEGAGVRLASLPAWRFAYVRIYDSYANQEEIVAVYNSLVAWLRERGTDFQDVVMVGMSMDDPTVTPGAQCRYDMGVAFPLASPEGLFKEIFRARGRRPVQVPPPDRKECDRYGLSLRDFEPCTVAAFRCIGDVGAEVRALQYFYGVWLPRRGYDLADLPGMEMFVRIPEEIGWETFDLECVVAVQP